MSYVQGVSYNIFSFFFQALILVLASITCADLGYSSKEMIDFRTETNATSHVHVVQYVDITAAAVRLLTYVGFYHPFVWTIEQKLTNLWSTLCGLKKKVGFIRKRMATLCCAVMFFKEDI